MIGEEMQVEEDQGNGEVDVDLHRDICTDISVRQSTIVLCYLLNDVQISWAYQGDKEGGTEISCRK